MANKKISALNFNTNPTIGDVSALIFIDGSNVQQIVAINS